MRMVDRSLNCRSITPTLIGFCVGISISVLIINTGIESSCNEKTALFADIFERVHNIDSLPTEDLKNTQDENTEDLSEFDPRINLAGKPHSARKEPQTLIRPRYFSTELGIKEKTFVAILSSIRHIPSLGLAINETLAHHVNRLAFFVEVAGADKLDVKTLPIVGFKDAHQQGLLTLHTLKYLADKLAVGYSYFLLIKDTTYVDGRKLEKLTKHISITEHVYMGVPGANPTSNPSVCSLDSGILLSSSVLLAISPFLETCTEEFAFNSDDEKIGLCILRALNITCQSEVQGQTFSTFNIDAQISDIRHMEKAWETDPGLSNALTCFHAREPVYFFMLNHLSCSGALRNIGDSIQELESSILRLAPNTPDELHSVSWPVGVSPPSKQETRFNVLHWKFFNATHIFFDTEHSAVKPLNGAYLEDVQDVTSAAVAHVLKDSPELKYLDIDSGYMRFDPTRGMDYILDLIFSDILKGKLIIRVEGCRPITHVDTVPMPYVTESSVVHIVVVLQEDEGIAVAEKFLHSYGKNVMSKSDKSELNLVLLNREPGTLKTISHTLNTQYKKQGSRINILTYKQSVPFRKEIEFFVADLIGNKLGPGSLVFMCNPYTEIYPDLLNRVRINTISGWQLFSPMPFAEFNPDVSFPGLTRQEVLNVSTNQGFYDIHDTQHISFYVADYLNARKTFEGEQPLLKSDRNLQSEFVSPYESILAMFVRLHQLHVLRAVEPHLRMRYHERKCVTHRCQESFLLSQGTRSQLAQFALDRESPAIVE